MNALIAIVGRPNVGKSALFNRLVKLGRIPFQSSAITESTPGVTRDRNYGRTEWEGKQLTIVDTGGFYADGVPKKSKTLKGVDGIHHETSEIARQVKEQALFAVNEADVIIHLLDGKEGLNPADLELAGLLRKSGKKILWAVNKIDSMIKEDRALEFYSIGAEKIVPVSAITGLGIDELMDLVLACLPAGGNKDSSAPEETSIPRIAVVGRPNAGKSTLINSLLGKSRHIVSPVPGTTRDPVDSICTHYRKKYLFVDTAGIRKKQKGYSLESFSMIRAVKSIERADVAVIVLDASEGITDQDQRIAGLVDEYGKGALFLLNKWDLVKDPETAFKEITSLLNRKMWFMHYAPVVTVSGLEKTRITRIFSIIDEIIAERKKRIPTGELNKFMEKLLAAEPLPRYKGKEVKLHYITQAEIEPPVFAIFANYPSVLKAPQLKHIEKNLRDQYSFKGTPIKIHVKPR
ncbi:MAG TPA: ribosome biogenesis GTPase Der [Dissulfurispiraceae bacterium]|nr:ribosome biogenesis GTPase Der [Dissulfurispiraceae bacterium]